MLLPHRLHLSRCSWHYIFHHYSSCRFARWCCGCVCLALNVAGDRWKRQAPGSLFVFDCEAGGGRDHVPDLWHPHAKRQRHIHTHTWTHAPSVTGPWQAWPRRGGWAKRRWREAEGEEAECRTPPAILHPLFPSLSLGPSFLIPWQWPCAPPPPFPLTHTHTEAGCPCQPHKTDTSSAQWPLFLPPSVISTDRMSKEGLGWEGVYLTSMQLLLNCLRVEECAGVVVTITWNEILFLNPLILPLLQEKHSKPELGVGWGRVGYTCADCRCRDVFICIMQFGLKHALWCALDICDIWGSGCLICWHTWGRIRMDGWLGDGGVKSLHDQRG